MIGLDDEARLDAVLNPIPHVTHDRMSNVPEEVIGEVIESQSDESTSTWDTSSISPNTVDGRETLNRTTNSSVEVEV